MSQAENLKVDRADEDDDLGRGKMPLCREPWESYYILRRGILPCCHGNPIIAPISDWAAAWNSPQVQEIRRHLSQGRLSPYCLESRGCPIVQRVLYEQEKEGASAGLPGRPRLLRFLNRLMFRIPGRLARAYRQRKQNK